MKLRLLNAGHSVLGILGALHGHQTINDCMADPVFAQFMRKFMDQEATPTLPPLTGIDLNLYKDTLEQRFANPNIKDSVSRICSQTSAKLPVFLIPTLVDNLKTGGKIEQAALVIAAWCLYSDRQKNENDEPLEIIDDAKQVLHQAACQTTSDQLSFIKQKDIFGDLASNIRFAEAYKEAIELVYGSTGIREVMQNYLANH